MILIDYEKANALSEEYGDAYYLLDSEQFRKNYAELKHTFQAIYPEFNIAYSYKTNYTPKLCKIVDALGGYAEVVSAMEMEIALRCGVKPEYIIWNGPYKDKEAICRLLLLGGTVNLDSAYEISVLEELADTYPDKILNIGVRCNFEINDGVLSRFGYGVETDEFMRAISLPSRKSNIHLVGLQCHFASRALRTWKPRVEGMLDLVERLGIVPSHIDLGGGLFGKMEDSLKLQFDTEIPTYEEYAMEVASVFAEHFATAEKKPLLLIEPGSALVGDCMKFVARVVNIKEIRGKAIATLLGSIYNINPTLNKKNPPLNVLAGNGERKTYRELDFGGFTCIESDYLYRGYTGELAVGDFAVFGNVGSYSVVLKPPFILPNFPILDICDGRVEVIKKKEEFDDIFRTYYF